MCSNLFGWISQILNFSKMVCYVLLERLDPLNLKSNNDIDKSEDSDEESSANKIVIFNE